MTGIKIIKTEVKMYVEEWICDKDGCENEMKPTGVCLTSNPPQYLHKCSGRGREETTFNYTYPRLVKEKVE